MYLRLGRLFFFSKLHLLTHLNGLKLPSRGSRLKCLLHVPRSVGPAIVQTEYM
jgi:hypothetical protein